MIQRKQTLFLLISGLLMLLICFIPVLKISSSDALFALNTTGIENLSGEVVQPTWVLFGLDILVVLLSFVTIFLYNKRVLQMRLTIFNLILKVGIYALFYLYYSSFATSLEGCELSITPWLSFPLIAMIFDYLAYRGIAVDEKTIRFMDRLR